MGTLSKAAGCFGAYVCGKKTLRDYLINKSRSFIYTTALPASLAQAARASVQIIKEGEKLRRLLMSHAEYVRKGLRKMGFDIMNSQTPIIPILIKDPLKTVAMSRQLLAKGIFIQPIRHPTVPQDMARLRLTVTAAHQRADLDKLLDVLKGL
ncbi:MAG: aminotransferase class I/II-fold pyridoxal phosphate-dependent enzyme [Candidatus Omnitrophica bacterium]|nr:aminotransferase class I/II-fold pyridoxal phosphate-dependent enzyme [Candidatus Omnitrophota bacterium]